MDILLRMIEALKSFLFRKLWNVRNRTVPGRCISAFGKDVRIMVITHTDAELPSEYADGRVYLPLRVGNACLSGEHADWPRDNVGDNISKYNLLINEMTGIYWVAKHYVEIGAPEYIGICHYRRSIEWNESILKKNRVIATSGFRVRSNRHYLQMPQDAVVRDEAVKMFEGTEYDDYEDYLDSHTLYCSNLLITDKMTFFRYFTFIEKCIRLCIGMIVSNAVDLSGLSNYERRYYGFFLEEMTSYWLYHEKRRKKIDLYLTHEVFWNIPNLETSLH